MAPIAPRESYRELGGPADAPGSVWSIVCFFVPRRLREQGMAKRLTGAAVDHAKERGAAVVEAYPVDPDSPSYRFMGYVGSFEAMGFRAIGRAGTRRHPHLNPPPFGEEARQDSNRQMEKHNDQSARGD